MKYDNVFQQFIEQMMASVGVTPNNWEHHIITRSDSVIGFAYFDQQLWKWVVPSIYPKLTYDDLYTMTDDLRVAIDDYDMPRERPVPEIIGPGDAFTVIKEAKESKDFDEMKWGIDNEDESN